MQGRERSIVVALCLLASGCGSDSSTPAADQRAAGQEEGIARDAALTPPLGQSPSGTPDQGRPPLDGGGNPATDSSICPAPKAATSNSGRRCSVTNPCPSGEECVATAAGSATGMCLGQCCPNLNNPNDPRNTCPVADLNRQLSSCIFTTTNPQGVLTGYVCVWVCAAEIQGQALTFDCPDATSYACVAPDPSKPLKICVPK